ncbi:rho GTPase-activating protein 8-like [Xiphophorus maculatus]|uniref:rho GTPase-activating protein 8-like n=1 Tax=Xiphophorus maculatus TaxID=8083 RepID=UPI000C6E6188|nr:rho GTPase-activating protein 8-like [Xiphophorus maculatus]
MTNTSDLEQLAEIELQKEEEEDEEEQRAVPDGPSRTDPSHPYYDVARHGIIQVSGDDNYGRKLIVFSSCCLPPSHQLNHRRLLEYEEELEIQEVDRTIPSVADHPHRHQGR